MKKIEMEYGPSIPTVTLYLIPCIRFRKELLKLGLRWELLTFSRDLFSYHSLQVQLWFKLEHVYMRPEVNSNRFDISLRGKVSLRCKVTSLSAFIWLWAEWKSLRYKFQTTLRARLHETRCELKPVWDFTSG